MPPPDLRLSVFQIKALSEQDVWEIGKQSVAGPQNKTLRGRAEITVSAVHHADLRVDPDNEPPRHASIVGWPEEKHGQKMLDLELAAKAALKLVPERR